MSLILSFLSTLIGSLIAIGITIGFYFYFDQRPIALLPLIIPTIAWIRWIYWIKKLKKEVEADNKLLQEKKQNPTLPKGDKND